jgi:hypothetical protein
MTAWGMFIYTLMFKDTEFRSYRWIVCLQLQNGFIGKGTISLVPARTENKRGAK